ncbi:MAG: hypothetical protein LCH54_10145 [Bacteroidetes bacterium]|nr:hypothetical protein [Bacteroidota bacterium]
MQKKIHLATEKHRGFHRGRRRNTNFFFGFNAKGKYRLELNAKENSFGHRETQRFSQKKEEEYKFLFWV